MNERIQALAEQAGFIDRGTNHTAYMNFDHEKFAELIVRECMSNLYLHGYDDAAKCLQDIHFGIEDPV